MIFWTNCYIQANDLKGGVTKATSLRCGSSQTECFWSHNLSAFGFHKKPQRELLKGRQNNAKGSQKGRFKPYKALPLDLGMVA